MSISLRSPRLELILMEPVFLEALLDSDHKRAEQVGGFHIPNDFVISQRTLARRLRQIQTNPEVQPWLLRAIIIKQSMTMCGRIGFHSAPRPGDLRDVAADGVELGYEIAEPFRRQGFAKEALITMIKWAFEQHQQRSFILSISPENEASLALAHSLAFKEIGSQIDPEDGLELYFERRLTDWPENWERIISSKQSQLKS